MGKIYEVRGNGNSGRLHSYGAKRTPEEAEALLAESKLRVARAGGKVQRWWIEEIDTTGLFELPSLPTPRRRFKARAEPRQVPGYWATSHVDVYDGEKLVTSYDRNYSMLQTFEPFRQGEDSFALVAPDYTATSVMNLQTGEIIASEEPNAAGFCPVGFYVPDWWDIHDDSILPGSTLWSADKEWPNRGDFGFVWGCMWGDDSSWKVQYLDLSKIQEGRIQREERFGYLKLATRPNAVGKEIIRLWSWRGTRHVEFTMLQTYDLGNGQRLDLDPWE